MTIAPEATTIINDYIDRVRMALPLAPSTRLAVADRLYHDIVTACAAKAHDAGRATIDADIVRAHLETLGTPENCANALSAAFQAGTWQWPGDYVAAHFGGRFSEQASEFARVAAEKGERFAGASMDSVASALDIAARKLRAAAENLKTRQ